MTTSVPVDPLLYPAAEWLDPVSLVPWEANPRRNAAAISAVARSIKELGFGAPVVARRSDLRIIAGHTRVEAAKRLKLGAIPVRLVDLDDEKATRMAILDNKTGELSEWDLDALLALGADLADLGWTEAELEDIGEAMDPHHRGGPTEEFGGTGSRPPEKRSVVVSLMIQVEDAAEIESALDEVAAREGLESRGEALLALCRSKK